MTTIPSAICAGRNHSADSPVSPYYSVHDIIVDDEPVSPFPNTTTSMSLSIFNTAPSSPTSSTSTTSIAEINMDGTFPSPIYSIAELHSGGFPSASSSYINNSVFGALLSPYPINYGIIERQWHDSYYEPFNCTAVRSPMTPLESPSRPCREWMTLFFGPRATVYDIDESIVDSESYSGSSWETVIDSGSFVETDDGFEDESTAEFLPRTTYKPAPVASSQASSDSNGDTYKYVDTRTVHWNTNTFQTANEYTNIYGVSPHSDPYAWIRFPISSTSPTSSIVPSYYFTSSSSDEEYDERTFADLDDTPANSIDSGSSFASLDSYFDACELYWTSDTSSQAEEYEFIYDMSPHHDPYAWIRYPVSRCSSICSSCEYTADDDASSAGKDYVFFDTGVADEIIYSRVGDLKYVDWNDSWVIRSRPVSTGSPSSARSSVSSDVDSIASSDYDGEEAEFRTATPETLQRQRGAFVRSFGIREEDIKEVCKDEKRVVSIDEMIWGV